MMLTRWIVKFATVAAAVLSLPLAGSAAGPQLQTLEPGGFREIAQDLKVNVVFVGFSGTTAINSAAFQGALPATYRSIHRYPDFYGTRQYTGNRFNFNYNVSSASAAYADSLFAFLAANSVPQARTLFQDIYNSQGNKALAVGQNHFIDVPTVEAWLAQNPPPGVNTSTYTVYFINWYGRPDFKFHVYTKTDVADPDTGDNFGINRNSRKMVAWGGTPVAAGAARRVWFYDFSAGPESWNGNYDISNSDFDGDGQADYRIPVIWDYGNPSGYRPFNDLTGNAARLARFVAINLLFTTSPLYKPAISAPVLPGAINIDLNFFQGDASSNALDFIKPAQVAAELAGLQRHNTFTADTRAYGFDARVRKTFLCFTFGPSWYGNKLGGVSFGDLFLFSNAHLIQYLDGNQGYEVPVFHFNVSDDLSGGLLGFADDYWSDGTQSYVFGFLAPGLRAAGYVHTTLLEWDNATLWRTYAMLTNLESVFRSLKTDLGLRPVFHQIDRRVQGHLFISVLACHFVHTMRLQREAEGIDDHWETLRQTLGTQRRVTATMQRRDGRAVQVRKAARPEPYHQTINKILALDPNPGGTHRVLV